MITRRSFIAGLGGLSFSGLSRAHSFERPTIGAIRWDAWYTQSNADGIRSVVQKTLRPSHWQSRAPSCAMTDSDDTISFDSCGLQSRIDFEIQLANRDRIDYWAYCWFGKDHPMQRAWRLHQKSALADLVKWCQICSFAPFVRQAASDLQEAMTLLRMQNYQSVIEGRPLIFLLNDKTDSLALARGIASFRGACASNGVRDPYIALMLSGPRTGIVEQTGADAIGTYAKAGPTPIGGAYSDLVKIAEHNWRALADTGQAVVPTAMSGWDTRPRQETETPWPTNHRGPNGEEPFFVSGTPSQIAAHVRNMYDWIKDHPLISPAQTGLVYSWNEHDEGGSTLNPTIGNGDAISNAIGRALD